MKPVDKNRKTFASNRRALKDYTILDRIEAGIELRGTEVKSVREGSSGLAGSYAAIEHGEMILRNLNIPPYEYGNIFNHNPMRPRRLLLHKKEIIRLASQIEQKGCTVIPLHLYPKKGMVKVELAVCKGKRKADKRETLRRKTAEREAERAISRRFR